MTNNTINREISWLSFNSRVLQEAQDESVPLIERLVFLGIVSSNLDEFFRVRVATIKRLVSFGKKGKKGYEDDPELVLEEIHSIVSTQQRQFESTYKQILKGLKEENIFLVNENKLNKSQKEFVQDYFDTTVKPTLGPIMLDQATKLPMLKDKNIYLAVKLMKGLQEKHYSLVKIPSDVLNRFLVLPSEGDKHFIMLLDDVIRFSIIDLFPSYDFDKAEAYTIKFTRDAELDIDNDVSSDFMAKMSKGLKQRSKGDPVRIVYDEEIPADLLRVITDKMGIKKLDQMLAGGRYHNFKDFIGFPRVGGQHLQFERREPLFHKDFEREKSLFKAIQKKDILVHYPYHTFNYFTNLIREAAIDPNVSVIRMTAYRLAKNSQVADALINAANNGKRVVLFIELLARFDEKANIKWAEKLKEEGIEVHYGLEGYKVHSKILQITRKEGDVNKYYTCIGTGNFHESTAKIYSDHTLFTFDQGIGASVRKVFSVIEKKKFDYQFSKLWVSPINVRTNFNNLVDEQIVKAKKKQKAEIFLKVNNLIDRDIINKLYEAGNSGVKIRLIIRGVNGLISKEAKNIEAISIVDRYLEHSRIFIFGSGNNKKIFLTSADLMKRNLDHRVEVGCEVLDKAIKKELKDFMEIQWKGNVKARIWDRDLQNIYVQNEEPEFRAQDELYKYVAQTTGVEV